MVTESLEMTLGFKTWPAICLGSEPRTFGSQVKAMVYWLRCWILNQGVLGFTASEWFQARLSCQSFKVDEMCSRYSWGPKGNT